VTGLAESNDCGLTAAPGSAPGPALGKEHERTLVDFLDLVVMNEDIVLMRKSVRVTV